MAVVGALLLSFTAGIPFAGAAQAPSSGSIGETSAAFSSVEKLKLTLALSRSYRLTGEPQRALDTLAPLSAGPWPSAAIEAEYHDEVARDEAGERCEGTRGEELGRAERRGLAEELDEWIAGGQGFRKVVRELRIDAKMGST